MKSFGVWVLRFLKRILRLFIGRSSPNDFSFLSTPFSLRVKDVFGKLMGAGLRFLKRILILFIGRSSPGGFVV